MECFTSNQHGNNSFRIGSFQSKRSKIASKYEKMKGIITLYPAQEKYLNLLSREEEGAADTLEDYRYSYLNNLAFVTFLGDII